VTGVGGGGVSGGKRSWGGDKSKHTLRKRKKDKMSPAAGKQTVKHHPAIGIKLFRKD